MIAPNDLDHLAARLHGRRARRAEGGRLSLLCGLPSVAELGAALFPGAGISTSAAIQVKLEEDFFQEVMDLARALSGARAAFLEWVAARLKAENLKVAMRGISAGASSAETRRLISGSAAAMGPYGPGLALAKTPEDLLNVLPADPLRDALKLGYGVYGVKGEMFFLEAAVDRGYLSELLAMAAALSGAGGDAARALAVQEADIFHLALMERGMNSQKLESKALLALHVRGSAISRRKFSRMLSAQEQGFTREPAAGTGLGGYGMPAGMEREGWRRYARLAVKAFRESNVDFGISAGYAALLRLEAAKLTMVAEGLRLRAPAAELRARAAL